VASYREMRIRSACMGLFRILWAPSSKQWLMYPLILGPEFESQKTYHLFRQMKLNGGGGQKGVAQC
jgi:hypothetical protein